MTKARIQTAVLEHCDAIYNTAERLAIDNPLDAMPIARALLGMLLRLAWVQCSGKFNTNPDPKQVPVRLFQKHVVTKGVMRRFHHAVNKDASTSNLLECCRCLMIWLASEPGTVIDDLKGGAVYDFGHHKPDAQP